MNTSKLKVLVCLTVLLGLAGQALALPHPPTSVPDAGSSSMLLMLSLGGIGFARRFFTGNKKS